MASCLRSQAAVCLVDAGGGGDGHRHLRGGGGEERCFLCGGRGGSCCVEAGGHGFL